jgi:hypothetical protein
MSIQFAPIWNDVSLAQTCIRANATDTASAATSTLIDLSVNGISQFSVDKTGDIIMKESSSPQTPPSGYVSIYANSGKLKAIDSSGTVFTLSNSISSLNTLTDATQTFATGTTGTDFAVSSASGVHTFNLPDASATARGVVTTGTQTIAGDKTLTGTVRITGGGQNMPTLRLAAGNVYGMWHTSNGWTFTDGSTPAVRLSAAGLHVVSPAIFGSGYDGAIGWGNIYQNTMVTQWREDAANVIGQRNGVNAQVYRLYSTYTDTSNYERLTLQFVTYSSARYAQLACESAGTGIANMNLVLTPKGTGSLITGPAPDGTATGGNARGAYAIDLQLYRASASQVAGDYGVAIGNELTVTGGGSGAIAIGRNLSVSDSIGGGVVMGRNSAVTGHRGIAIGAGVTAANDAVAIGTGSGSTHGGGVCFIGTFSRWSGNILWTGAYSQSPGGANYLTHVEAGGIPIASFFTRTTSTAVTTLYSQAIETLSAERYRRRGAIYQFEGTITAIRSDGAMCKWSRRIWVRSKASHAGTVTNFDIIANETIGTDITEIAGIGFAVTATLATQTLAITVTGETDYACTGDSTTDVITAVGHTFVENDLVIFNSITGGAGLTANPTGQYYQGFYKVVNVSGNTFQLANGNSTGITLINFTTDITAGRLARAIIWSVASSRFSLLCSGY